MTGLKRLALVVVVALAGFGAAVVALAKEAERGCLLEAPRDPSYAAGFEDPVTMDESTHVIIITRRGRPADRVDVCLNTDMVGMTGMAMTAEATRLGPGRYGLSSLQFPMVGQWTATVIVDNGERKVGIPLRFQVHGDDMMRMMTNMRGQASR